MHIQYTNSFINPYKQDNLNFHLFKQEGNDVKDGIFVHLPSQQIYPVIDRVPVFIKNRVFVSFWEIYKKEILAVVPNESKIKSQLIESPENFIFRTNGMRHTKTM